MHVYDTGAGDSICHASVYGLIKKKKDEKTESTYVYGARVCVDTNVYMQVFACMRMYICMHTYSIEHMYVYMTQGWKKSREESHLVRSAISHQM